MASKWEEILCSASDSILRKRYGKPSGSTHIKIFKNSQNREMALDPSLQSAKVFVESMPQIDFLAILIGFMA